MDDEHVAELGALRADAVRDQQTIFDLQGQGKLDREQIGLDQEQIRLLEADHAAAWDTIAVLQSQATADHQLIEALRSEGLFQRDKIANLELALTTARRIGAAIGIVMTTMKVTEEQAFAALSLVSQDANRKLREVAEDVVLTGVLPNVRGE